MEKNNGFSYVETLIVMMVIGVLALMGRTAYSNFNYQKQLTAETKKAVSYFDLAQQQTLSGEKPCDTFLGSYTLSLTQPEDTILLEVIPSGCPTQVTYSFPLGYTLPSGDFLLNYEPFGSGATGSSCAIIEQDQTGQCGKFSIEPSGNVKDEMLTAGQCTCP